MTEVRWYRDSHDRGEPPPAARLSRRSMQEQWQAAIDLAIAVAEGRASYRPTRIIRTYERYWHWQGNRTDSTRGETSWWLLPWRVEKRALLLHRAAVRTTCRARGSASPAAIVQTLERWQRSGHWRRLVVGIQPRHPGPRRRPRGRKRRGGRPARRPRALP